VSRDTAARRRRLLAIVDALPEVGVTGDRHLKLAVRKKTFAYYLDDHHGDGRVAIACKASPFDQQELIESDPESYYRPHYLGARGWVALRLDLRRVDWNAVGDLLSEAYRLQAPRKLAARLGRSPPRPTRRRR
jgi:hypothetical protein